MTKKLEQTPQVSNPNVERVRRLLESLNAAERREEGVHGPARPNVPAAAPPATALARRMPIPFWAAAIFLFIAAGALWEPSRWAWESLRGFHGQREWTPAGLSGSNGRGPVLSARRPTEIRPQFSGTRPTTFRLLAPAARDVFLGGSFNGFNGSQTPMVRGNEGIWEVTLSLSPGRHTYKFKVDGKWLLDPANPEKTPEPRERSLIHVPS